jgi:hypothetical protein
MSRHLAGNQITDLMNAISRAEAMDFSVPASFRVVPPVS